MLGILLIVGNTKVNIVGGTGGNGGQHSKEGFGLFGLSGIVRNAGSNGKSVDVANPILSR